MSNYLSPGSTSHKISQNCRGSCQLPLQITDYGMQIVATTFTMIPASAHRLLPSRKVRGRVEKIRRAEHEHDVVVVVILPPTLVMPFCVVVAKRGIVLSLPVLASFNVSALLKVHRRRFRDVWLF